MTNHSQNAARAPDLAGARPQLVSHALCPYVQRVAIALAEKGVAFDRVDIDLSAKPAWFVALSPAGKVPLLRVGEATLFESAAILEYLEDVAAPKLHPADALVRAEHRAWMEFGSGVLADIAGFYSAPDEAALAARRAALAARFRRLEARLDGRGPWFDGAAFSLVDACFAPVFRYFDAFERLGEGGMLDGLAKVAAWRTVLAGRRSVREAVAADYPQRLGAFLAARSSALSRRSAIAA